MARKKKKTTKKTRSTKRKGRSRSGVNFLIKLIPIVVIVGIIALSVKGVSAILFKSDYFTMKNINLEGADSTLYLGSISNILNPKKGLNIFRVDLKSCETAIRRKHPGLKDVRVRRLLPDTIEVSYDIRRPFCQIDSGRFYIVSEEGVILPNPRRSPDPILPIITGTKLSGNDLLPGRKTNSRSLTRAMTLLKEIGETDFSQKYNIVKINAYDVQNPSLYLEDGTRIEIGEYSFKERYKVFEDIMRELNAKGKKAKVIDLRFEDVVVLPR